MADYTAMYQNWNDDILFAFRNALLDAKRAWEGVKGTTPAPLDDHLIDLRLLPHVESEIARRTKRIPAESVSIKQAMILNFISRYTDQHGYPPSMADIKNGCRFSSTSVVKYNVERLRQNGWVTLQPNTARTIRLLRQLPKSVIDLAKFGESL